MSEKVYYSTGDLGDIVASLCSVKAAGGGHYRIGYRENGQRENMHGSRFESIKPLIEAQPYIKSCEWTWDSRQTLDFSTFRDSYQLHRNLAVQQSEHVGVVIDVGQPWLSVSDPIPHGVAVVARSPRYWNPLFPWRRVLEAYPDRIFVGLRTEHKAFQDSFGEISYYPTRDLLELARVIAGSTMVISNQTCCWWIAAGLGVPRLIQETMQRDQNSIIERPGYVYTRNISEVQALIDMLPRPAVNDPADVSFGCSGAA